MGGWLPPRPSDFDDLPIILTYDHIFFLNDHEGLGNDYLDPLSGEVRRL